MSPAVVPAKVLMFEKSGIARPFPPVSLVRRDGSLAVPRSWLNAVKAQYTRVLRGESRARVTSLAAVPDRVQLAIVEWMGQAWKAATVYRLEVGLRGTVGATAFVRSPARRELFVFTESAALLATGFALPGDDRFTWRRS